MSVNSFIRGVAVAGFKKVNPINYSTDVVASRTINTNDLQTLVEYNSAIAGSFTIPTDTVLGIAGNSNNFFYLFQKGVGVMSIIAGAGVTLNVPAGFPASVQYTTQYVHRVGPNTWAIK